MRSSKYYYFNQNILRRVRAILNKIKNFKKKIVRSAYSDEDNTSSNAGKYLSSQICSKNLSLVEKSINKVFKSDGRVKKGICFNQNILKM